MVLSKQQLQLFVILQTCVIVLLWGTNFMRQVDVAKDCVPVEIGQDTTRLGQGVGRVAELAEQAESQRKLELDQFQERLEQLQHRLKRERRELSEQAATLQNQKATLKQHQDEWVAKKENEQAASPPVHREVAQVGEHHYVDEDEDPLDDHVDLSGFPKQPLTMNDVKMCDPDSASLLKKSWRCPSDPTCKQCHSSHFDRFTQLNEGFRDAEVEETRRTQIKKFFSPLTKKDAIVVAAVNYGQLYLFLNWVCSLEKLNLDPRPFTAIVASDTESDEILRKLGFFVPDSSWMKSISPPILSRYNGGANMGGHSDINNILLMLAVDVFEVTGNPIIFHDVDMTWASDPRDYLYQAGKRRDILAMIAPYYDASGIINSGFVYVRNSKKSHILLRTLENLAYVKNVSDQQLWNNALRNYMLGQISFRILSNKLFYKYSGHKFEKPTEKMLLYHAVGVKKVAHMKFHNQWFFTAECSVFDDNLPAVGA